MADPTLDDINRARDLLSRHAGAVPDEADVRLIALGIGAERRSHVPGAISDEELRFAHDMLYADSIHHRAHGVLESIAEALLRRGVVPSASDYDGEWWLWWPHKGRGPCQGCGNERSLIRYSNVFGKTYRYLCRRCREREVAGDEAALNHLTGVVPQPGESPDSVLVRRMQALIPTMATDSESDPRTEPDEDQWTRLAEDLENLLAPLAEAGWDLPDSYRSDFDADGGPLLFESLTRTGMVIDLEYEPRAGTLRLLPYVDVTGERPDLLSMLDNTVTIVVGEDATKGTAAVSVRAGELGLLDATRIDDEDLEQVMSLKYGNWILEPARLYRQITAETLAAELDAYPEFSLYFKVVVTRFGRGVLPDLVPSAVAMGIAAWCWRNDTAVEDWHLADDVLMARTNIAVTRAIRPHVDTLDGCDWEGIEVALTDRSLALADGSIVADLFGQGWPEVEQSVRKQIRQWRRFDEELVGPEATLRLLTIGGSTSYTRHWWGQGRWPAICKQILTEAVAAGVPLPFPYAQRGLDALIADLADPDLLSDAVLAWFIDMPDAGTGGPHGLRYSDATKPIVREILSCG